MRSSYCPLLLFAALLTASVCAPNLFAQRHHKKPAAPTPAVPHTPEVKPDYLTLRYKPQAGTLLYDVHTRIDQSVRTERDELSGYLASDAELAFHNVSIDYKKGLWSFDESFTKFDVAGHTLAGDSLWLRENLAVNRITALTYNLKGDELKKVIRDSLKLLNAEAQTNAYFFEPPRMLIPLPEHTVTFGDAWFDHRSDTIPVHDTINIGTTTGEYVYDVSRTYHLARLIDTEYLAIIVGTDTGSFQGYQTNSVTNVTTKSAGPISGADTTYLDLFSGRVVKRTLSMTIPAQVVVSSATPFMDMLRVRSVVTLSESNAAKLKNEPSAHSETNAPRP